MSIRLMQFNLENFFLHLDKDLPKNWPHISENEWQSLTFSTSKLKPLQKIKDIAAIIIEHNPDILCLCEVGGVESLTRFNELFLNGEFDVQLIEGNSNRGIDVGFLVKKSLPYDFLLFSHKERPINFLYEHEIQSGKKSHYFSRDVAELRIFHKQRPKLELVILGVHLKSKLDPDNVDLDGRKRRTAEVRTLIDIYKEILEETNEKIPILLAGDFNGQANRSRLEPEFAPIYQETSLENVFDLLPDPPTEPLFTQIVFNSLNRPVPVHIDYIFLDKKFAQLIKAAKICHFKDNNNRVISTPKTLEERNQLPSDHYPTLLELKTKALVVL